MTPLSTADYVYLCRHCDTTPLLIHHAKTYITVHNRKVTGSSSCKKGNLPDIKFMRDSRGQRQWPLTLCALGFQELICCPFFSRPKMPNLWIADIRSDKKLKERESLKTATRRVDCSHWCYPKSQKHVQEKRKKIVQNCRLQIFLLLEARGSLKPVW